MRFPAIRRTAARALVRDDRDRVLVLLAAAAGQRWLELPGGGVDLNEDPAATAAREVAEETGYRHVEVGPAMACRRVRFRVGPLVIDQEETFHVGRLLADERAPARLEALELAVFQDVLWLDAAALAHPPARLDPPELPWLLARTGSRLHRLPDTDLTAMTASSPWGVRGVDDLDGLRP